MRKHRGVKALHKVVCKNWGWREYKSRFLKPLLIKKIMKRVCIIDIPEVKSKKAFMNELQIMLDDYGDMNDDAKDIHITVKEIVKEKK